MQYGNIPGCAASGWIDRWLFAHEHLPRAPRRRCLDRAQPTLAFYRALPNGELAVVPGTSHFFLQEKAALSNTIIIDFLTNEPVATVAPMRRSTAQPAALSGWRLSGCLATVWGSRAASLIKIISLRWMDAIVVVPA
jgi:hypothetical protein